MSFLGGSWDLGRAATAAATFGGSEAYRYASEPGNVLGKADVQNTPLADPANAQYGQGNGTDLSNQLAAQQYAAGLQQQGAQNDREGAFYNQANQNFDIANSAQLRGGPQISTSPVDQQRQLAALQGIRSSAGQLNQTGNTLTAMGTAPMGDSYAAAQLKQGQDAAMAQQLSMAHSGRSLGSGQAAMNQAAFNNSALNQQTNAQAAGARIQEQQNYNQFQLGALGAAGQNYGAAGSQQVNAGNLASGVRASNEGVQAQNANLNLQQQQTNNQTTGLYNNLGAQQQGFGMQANSLGQQANQFGAQQASNIMGAQASLNSGLNGQNTAVNMANTAAQNTASANQQAGNRAMIEDVVGMGAKAAASDARVKTNLIPLEPGGGRVMDPSIAEADGAPSPSMASIPAGTPGLTLAPSHGWFGSNSSGQMDPSSVAKSVADAVVKSQPGQSYLDRIDALNAQYAPSQHAPVDVLNRVPGAGAGPSASQQALLAHFGAKSALTPMSPTRSAALPFEAPHALQGSSLSPTASAALQGAATLPTRHVTSDQHSKARIQDLEGQLAALGGGSQKQPSLASRLGLRGSPDMPHPKAPDTAALDRSYAQQNQAPAIDLRPARGYSYEYKDPSMPGAAPGRQVGPMAQDLEKSPATAATVIDTPTGKQVDTNRLTMVNTAALSEQQRKTQELEQQLAALQGGNGGYSPAPYDPSLYGAPRGAY